MVGFPARWIESQGFFIAGCNPVLKVVWAELEEANRSPTHSGPVPIVYAEFFLWSRINGNDLRGVLCRD